MVPVAIATATTAAIQAGAIAKATGTGETRRGAADTPAAMDNKPDMTAWHVFAPIFTVPPTRDALVEGILSQVKMEFHVIVALNEYWSVALGEALSQRTSSPLSIATTMPPQVTCVDATLSIMPLKHSRLVTDASAALNGTSGPSGLSLQGLTVLVTVAWINDVPLVETLCGFLQQLGARVLALACICLESTDTAQRLVGRYPVCGRSIESVHSAALSQVPVETFPLLRYWHACERANDPCEDRIAIMTSTRHPLQLFTVIDGHGGAAVAEFLREHLLTVIIECLEKILRSEDKHSTEKMHVTPEAVARAMQEAFEQCDAQLLQSVRETVAEKDCARCCPGEPTLQTSPATTTKKRPRSDETVPAAGVTQASLLHESARSGACAVVAGFLLDKRSGRKTVVTAHVGDCKAVIFDMSCGSAVTPDDITTPVSDSSTVSSKHRRVAYNVENYKQQDHDDCINGNHTFLVTRGSRVCSLTLDHTWELETEFSAVSHRTRDPHPFRQSENDVRRLGSRAAPRVAGSLSVTRAFGDAYLKDPKLSCAPFASGCPYITALPDVSVHPVTSEDRFLILASDGLWDVLAPADLPAAFHSIEGDSSQAQKGLGARFMSYVLELAAERCNLSAQTLKQTPAGSRKRELLDDISVIIVDLQSRPLKPIS